MSIALSEALKEVQGIVKRPVADPVITGVVCDSRRVLPGSLFVAVRGAKTDGHMFLRKAFEAGAGGFVVEDEGVETFGVPTVVVKDSEAALGLLASAFWGHPSKALTLIGITGTNGKTTTTFLIQHILSRAGIVTGRIGTVGYSFPSGEEESDLTTPDAPAFQAALARMVREGAQAVVAEISSQALLRKRVEGCSFACTVFTNLSQDHLDHHGTMEEYFAAKRLLFTDHPRLVEAVVNADDPWGRMLAPDLGGHVVTFGVKEGDIRFEVLGYDATGTDALVHYPEGKEKVRLPLAGEFNASNAAAAVATAWALGLNPAEAVKSLGSAPQTPGRLEAVKNDSAVAAFVDYAHTPDALNRVLEALHRVSSGRLLTLFGCGGDRDRGKRPLMAKAAAAWSDLVVITADNSRSESTEAILDEIEAGFPSDWRKLGAGEAVTEKTFRRVEDRREALEWLAANAKAGDTLLVAGKGHETTQTIGEKVAPFDDRLELAAALAKRRTA